MALMWKIENEVISGVENIKRAMGRGGTGERGGGGYLGA
jgi:hypothetical protein